MKKATLYEKLADILEKPQTAVNDRVELREEGWDSLAVMATIAAIDEIYDITVPSAQLLDCKTVGDIVMVVENTLNETQEKGQ